MSPKIMERRGEEYRPNAGRDAGVAPYQSAELADSLERAAWDTQSRFLDELREAVRG